MHCLMMTALVHDIKFQLIPNCRGIDTVISQLTPEIAEKPFHH